MSLTSKQEVFCRCIADGMTQKDSYITAYNTKASDQVIYNESSKLMLRTDIQERIKEIRKPLEDAINIKELTAKEQQIQFIKDRIQVCKEKQDEQSLIRYTDMLNKIYGIYKENDTQINDTSNNIEKLDNDTLTKLIRIS